MIRKRMIYSFITGGEDGYVRLCFFDDDYFTMVNFDELRLWIGWEEREEIEGIRRDLSK